MKKFILIYVLLQFTGLSLISAQESVNTSLELRRCCIAYVSNLSSKFVNLESNNLQIPLRANTINHKLVKQLIIPFVSIKHYLKQYIKDIPYIPEPAIKIYTPNKQFYMWQNESGVILAPDPKFTSVNADWKAKKIFDPLSSKTLTNILRLKLILDKNKFTIEEL